MKNVFISIGSNEGKRINNVINAIKEIYACPKIKIKNISSLYYTQPLHYEKQNWFINAIIKIDTELDPFALLQYLIDTEKKLGRKPSFKYGPRIIDLDILFYNNQIINSNNLVIPHPQFTNRKFLLKGMLQLDEEFIHPTLAKNTKQLYNEICLNQKVLKIPNCVLKFFGFDNKILKSYCCS
jgi:2-amino-4-hydroxy-6-hydroxymethyldihydropteridine diphosphokinase